MRKLLVTIAAASLLLCSCTNQTKVEEKVQKRAEVSLNDKYANEILKQLKEENKLEPKTWFYTSQTKEPEENDARIIEFYTTDPESYSIWLCQMEFDNVKCELIRITFYYH